MKDGAQGGEGRAGRNGRSGKMCQKKGEREKGKWTHRVDKVIGVDKCQSTKMHAPCSRII